MRKQALFESVESESEWLVELSRRIWETPELGMHEHESADTLIQALEAEGFDVDVDIAGLPTAFVASFGDGAPRIGVLGEFDALPDLSQRVSAGREPVTPGAPGHGCGHNLYGVGSLGAAVAVKRELERTDADGTVVYYGCPAEETLVGKVFIAREGVFDDLDACLAWHPMHLTYPRTSSSSLAMDSLEFRFEGESAHAAAAPDAGRSALDAVQLLNTGVEYMREHVSDSVRVHYTISDGGSQPNVVPSTASVWYYIRAPNRDEVEFVSQWVQDIAVSAATMTRTDVDMSFLTGVYDYTFNDRLNEIYLENMRSAPLLEYDDADRRLAAELRATIDDETMTNQLARIPETYRERIEDNDMFTDPLEPFSLVSGSADTANVSQITPFAMFRVACWPVGTPPHTWQATAANGDFAAKGMLYASKVLAATACDLLTEPPVLDAVQSEFEAEVGWDTYEDPLPSDAEPPFHLTER
jgi:aminobenzoyl-glutamate utilization protein B